MKLKIKNLHWNAVKNKKGVPDLFEFMRQADKYADDIDAKICEKKGKVIEFEIDDEAKTGLFRDWLMNMVNSVLNKHGVLTKNINIECDNLRFKISATINK